MVLKDNHTYITFHSGILTIGGTVIEVAYNDAHIFFDFGTEYRPELGLTEENMDVLMEHRLIPKLSHVYDERFKRPEDIEDNQFNETAVFLSHAHLDHSKMINYLDPSIPLYMLSGTKEVLKTMNEKGDFLLPSPFEEKTFTREMIGLEPFSKVKVGEIEVEIVPVDHDAYGAAALLIHTPDQFIVYTGDLRLHGFDSNMTPEFCKKAHRPDVLMMEGVSISFPEREIPEIATEPALIDEFVKIVSENQGKVVAFNTYPANVLRLAEIVKQSPRPVVLTATMAALLKETLQMDVPYYYLEGETLLNTLDSSLVVDYKDIIHDPSVIYQVHQYRVNDIPGGGIYIHSDAQPLGSFDPEYEPFIASLEERGVIFIRLAVSGHAFPQDLDKIVRMIEPKLLIPIHSYKPERLENPCGDRLLPERGQTIKL